MDLIKAFETESELDFLPESFVLTDEQKEAVFQQPHYIMDECYG
jgi:hypothetical protein